MSLNDTPSANRVHIGFFGLRNAGKSLLVNAVTGQDLSIVSEIAGTTTDPVYKAMEILPLGPVVIVDTPGIDDSGSLGEQRIQRARRVLSKIDEAVLVVDALKSLSTGLSPADRELVRLIEKRRLPYIIAYNKCDLLDAPPPQAGEHEIYVSAKEGTRIFDLKERMAAIAHGSLEDMELKIAGDLVQPGDIVVIVIPVDKAAPKGRLILAEQQTIRDIHDRGAVSVVTQDLTLPSVLKNLREKPALVIADSQIIKEVLEIVPENVPVTTFSILFVRYKGYLEAALGGLAALDALKDGDKVLICEGCTHHRQCDDIGTVKIPRWLAAHTGRALEFSFTSGAEFPEDLSAYSLILQCGGCMLTKREVTYRYESAKDSGVPITNYGTAIAAMNGSLPRCIKPLIN